jgi:hypothetical protein
MADLSLPPAATPISDARGLMPLAWRRFMEGVFLRLGGGVDSVSSALASARNAASAGDLAGVAAVSDGAIAIASLTGSYPVAVTITGVAASATATVSAHTRVYPMGSVGVAGGTATGLAYGTGYFLYYDQPTREGGTVSYRASAALADAFPSAGAPDRHFVGYVLTPASSVAANTTGVAAKPAGYAGP